MLSIITTSMAIDLPLWMYWGRHWENHRIRKSQEKNWQQLDLQYNLISDITPLAELVNLQDLHLRSNNIANIIPLAELANLQQLYLQHNLISDITPLSRLTHLRNIYISDNQIVDLKPLVDNPGLTNEAPAPRGLWAVVVYVPNNPLSNISRNVYIPALEARGVIVRH